MLASRPGVGWFEVHSENFFGDGGQPLHVPGAASARDYPVSLHGVGLSLGSADDPLTADHLAPASAGPTRIEPALVSEHLCWSALGGRHPQRSAAAALHRGGAGHRVRPRRARCRTLSARQILVENVSSYLAVRRFRR